jgi:hypothetical protein
MLRKASSSAGLNQAGGKQAVDDVKIKKLRCTIIRLDCCKLVVAWQVLIGLPTSGH